ncbi:MAG: hypothetical protein ACRC8S_08595 [Fimbriiglobus sp.]
MARKADLNSLAYAWWKRPLMATSWGAIPSESRLMTPTKTRQAFVLPRGSQAEFTDAGDLRGVALRTHSPNLTLLLQSLLALPTFTWLSLSLPGFADADLIKLPPCPSLTTLNLSETDVGDPSVAWLRASCASLTHLDLTGTQITDRGMKCLARMPNLQELLVDGTAITEAGLVAWHGAGRLRCLSVRKTAVSLDALDLLKSSLPNAAQFCGVGG